MIGNSFSQRPSSAPSPPTPRVGADGTVAKVGGEMRAGRRGQTLRADTVGRH